MVGQIETAEQLPRPALPPLERDPLVPRVRGLDVPRVHAPPVPLARGIDVPWVRGPVVPMVPGPLPPLVRGSLLAVRPNPAPNAALVAAPAPAQAPINIVENAALSNGKHFIPKLFELFTPLCF